jgi:hypothetical protein
VKLIYRCASDLAATSNLSLKLVMLLMNDLAHGSRRVPQGVVCELRMQFPRKARDIAV